MVRAILYPACRAALLLCFAAACSRSKIADQPSILLFVLDTTRADAVSAYGPVQGTTPALDALAASGLRYANAYANAPWTLPSHVSLFTGLPMSQHEVGTRSIRVPNALVMIAERLQAAGYETAGFSENPFVAETFNMTQGFDHFVFRSGSNVRDGTVIGDVTEWLHERSAHRPFFLFVNVMDAHAQYPIRDENRFVPVGATADAVRAVDRHVHQRICAQLPTAPELDILKGLYLGGVAAADAKLHAVRSVLGEEGVADRLITIVLSDHGEHFGERRLMEHNFSVHEALLRVPLVVAGLQGVKPAVIEAPVQSIDLVPTMLRWAGVAVPTDLPGRPLPTEAGAVQAPPFIEAQHTEPDQIVESGDEPDWFKEAHAQADLIRKSCSAEDRVFGSMVALLRHPYKLVWFERYPAQLYDVVRDPEERTDLAGSRPEILAMLRAAVDPVLSHSGRAAAAAPPATMPPEVKEQLRVLGYLPPATAAGSVTPGGAGP